MGKNSKGYSTGGGKKALIGVALFVLVAIVVVIILLCIPPNTYNAVQTLNRATETTFLARDAEKNEFNEAELSISGSAFSKYSNEFASIETLTNSVNAVLEFYNSKLIFANVDKNLKRNYLLILLKKRFAPIVFACCSQSSFTKKEFSWQKISTLSLFCNT